LNRILITIDTDFGLLIFADERPHRGLVRLPDCPAAERIAIFADLLARHEADLAAHAVITVSAGRVRISRPQKGND
jgi:predicted nuclease of predicted toxin-antitoxin system